MKYFGFAITIVAAICLAVPADAQVFNLGTFVVDDDASTGDIPLAIPVGDWTSYTLTTDWSAISGDPWSNEAIWALSDGPLGDIGTTLYADPGVSPDALASGDSVTLNWNGFFDVTLSNPPVTDGFFLSLQAFPGSTAQWANTVLTLGTDTPTLPTTNGTFDLSSSAMEMDVVSLGPAEVAWYEIVHPGGELTISTNFPETTILGTFDPVNPDTEVGLYSASGALLATNDDIDILNDILTSEIVIDVPAGNYYVATGGFNTIFGPAFDVSSTNPNSGDIKLAASRVVPEPGTLGLMALAGLALAALRMRKKLG